jgi:hypothetical protein
MKARVLAVVLPALLGLSACDKTKEPDPGPTPPKPEAELPRKITVGRPSPTMLVAPNNAGLPGEVAWDAPAGWKKVESPSPMRKATYEIPHAAPADADGELSVTVAGGTVESNVKRWAGQLDAKPGDVKREPREVGGLRVTVVEVHGTYTPMAMPGAPAAAPGPKPGYMLLGAIVETSPLTFFKLTGPEKTVVAARADFDKLVGSLRAK